MKFTYGYISHKQDVFDKHLSNSIKNIKNDIEIFTDVSKNQCNFFNNVIKNSKNRYIIFSHEDIEFSKDILKKIEESISTYNNFGVFCAAGLNKFNRTVCCSLSKMFLLKWADPCFFVIDKENDIFFDEINFNDYHFGVADYCLSLNKLKNKKTHTILSKWGFGNSTYITHFSNSCRVNGYRWGKYDFYLKVLDDKWKNC